MPQRKYNSPNQGKEMFFSGIYKITVEKTNYIYIGSCKRFSKRFKEHFVNLQKNNHRNSKMQNIFNKYGIESFCIQIIELHYQYDKPYCIQREQYWINFYKDSVEHCLMNLSLLAHCGNHVMSEEEKKKRSEKFKGKNNPHFGKTHSIEKRKEISEKLKISNQINKKKHLQHISELKEQGEFKRRALKAWENRSPAQLSTIDKMNCIISNYTKEQKQQKALKAKQTSSKKKGTILLIKEDKILKFLDIADAARFIGVSSVALYSAFKRNGKSKGYKILKIKED